MKTPCDNPQASKIRRFDDSYINHSYLDSFPTELLAHIIFQGFKTIYFDQTSLHKHEKPVFSLYRNYLLVKKAWVECANKAAIQFANDIGANGFSLFTMICGKNADKLSHYIRENGKMIKIYSDCENLFRIEHFDSLPNLQVLSLYDTSIDIGKIVAKCPNLQDIDVCQGPWTKETINSINQHCKMLKVLRMSGDEIDGTIADILPTLSFLECLEISECLNPKDFDQLITICLPNLRKFSYCPQDDLLNEFEIDLDVICRNFENLSSLDISSLRIGDTYFSDATYPQMKELSLSGIDLSDEELYYVACRFPHLSKLSLLRCIEEDELENCITVVGIAALAGLYKHPIEILTDYPISLESCKFLMKQNKNLKLVLDS